MNAVFSKTIKNVRNHVNVLIVHWEIRCRGNNRETKLSQSRSVISENLIAIEMRKLEVKFDKPIYMDMCIFDISKMCLYEFHKYMLSLFYEKCKIMYTDMDN